MNDTFVDNIGIIPLGPSSKLKYNWSNLQAGKICRDYSDISSSKSGTTYYLNQK